MKLGKKLIRLIFPPRCAACGILLPYDGDGGEVVLCRECRGEWEAAKLALCPVCGEAMLDCACTPAALAGTGCGGLIKLAGYDPAHSGSAVNRVINNMKKTNNRDTFDFFAAQLAMTLKSRLSGFGVERGRMIITFCPRRISAKREYGFDHAEQLARRVAGLCGVSFAAPVKRRRFVPAEEQKKLSAAERIENTSSSLRLNKRAASAVSGARIVIIDDVVTTGATTAVCAEIVRKAGAESVIVACLAATVRRG